MYTESIALQQRFVPQPVLRSSWQQLVMFGLEPDIRKHRARPHDMHIEGRFFAPAARFSFLPIPFSESKISAPAERKFGICAYGANRFFF